MKKIGRGKRFKISGAILHMALFCISLLFVLPLLMVISISFTHEDVLKSLGYSLIPKRFDTVAYSYIFANPENLLDAYKVTFFISIVGTLLSLIVMTMIGYSLSRRNFSFKKPVTYYIFFTMLFSGGLVPAYILNTQYLKLADNIWVYILPNIVNAWHIIIIRTFFKGLPEDLFESAKIDGASEMRIYMQIALPLSKPVLATVGLMLLLARWNEWYSSLLYIRNARLYTLQYLLQKMLRDAQFVQRMSVVMPDVIGHEAVSVPTESMRFAMCVIAAGPMLVVFPLFQKYFARGLTIGAVKG
jgi:putative aldouronate transport system permease protein